MAGKNQKRIRKILAKEGSVNIEVPSKGYHNSARGAFQTRRIAKVKYVPKEKAKPFPKPNDENVSLTHQRHVFNGIPCNCGQHD